MDGSSNQAETTARQLGAGTILVWAVTAARAVEMSAAVEGLGCGSWSISPIGLGGRTCYFDVILDRAASELELLLALGAQPRVY